MNIKLTLFILMAFAGNQKLHSENPITTWIQGLEKKAKSILVEKANPCIRFRRYEKKEYKAVPEIIHSIILLFPE